MQRLDPKTASPPLLRFAVPQELMAKIREYQASHGLQGLACAARALIVAGLEREQQGQKDRAEARQQQNPDINTNNDKE